VHPDDRAAAIETVRHAALADVQAQFSKMCSRGWEARPAA
jgi:hypothetical protein